MLDVYRLILALAVVQAHLWHNGPPWIAWQAVFSFYVVSGFLMTMILNERYGFSPGGFIRFAINRALRLFPVYLIVLAATVLIIVTIGPVNAINGAMDLPNSVGEWMANLFIVGLSGITHDPGRRLVPPAWSLAIEIVCYLVLALGAARSPRTLAVMLGLGILVSGWQIAADWSAPDYGFQHHYATYQAGLIPFALGGLAYFWRDALQPAPARSPRSGA